MTMRIDWDTDKEHKLLEAVEWCAPIREHHIRQGYTGAALNYQCWGAVAARCHHLGLILTGEACRRRYTKIIADRRKPAAEPATHAEPADDSRQRLERQLALMRQLLAHLSGEGPPPAPLDRLL